MKIQGDAVCDVLVVGSGAAGLTAAITARKRGLRVILVEKAGHWGGTTAISGGSLWIPSNPVSRREGINDSIEEGRAYLKKQMGERFDAMLADRYLHQAPQMLDFLESEAGITFYSQSDFPDFLPDLEGGRAGGRTICVEPFYGGSLAEHISRLPLPLYTQTALGMMTTPRDLKHFQNWVRSLPSFLYVARRLVRHRLDMARYGRTMWLTNGNALVARLVQAALDSGIPLYTETKAESLIEDGGQVCGAHVSTAAGRFRITAERGVVLACGGFGHNLVRCSEFLPRPALDGEDWSMSSPSVTGDGLDMAERIGADIDRSAANAALWAPTSRVPTLNGMLHGHYCDRHKPRTLAVTPDGRRFVNEAESYHHFCAALIEATPKGAEPVAWLITDRPGLKRYGLGAALAWPFKPDRHLQSGYLVQGATIRELAKRAGIDSGTLAVTVADFNRHASEGLDPQFGKGKSSFNRHYGHKGHRPNACVAPVEQGPYYAVRLTAGMMGTLVGLKVDDCARVLSQQGHPIPRLYAIGETAAHLFAGECPGAGIMLGAGMTFGFIAGSHLAGDSRGFLPVQEESLAIRVA